METTEVETQTPLDEKQLPSRWKIAAIIVFDFLQNSKPKDPNVRRNWAGAISLASFTAVLALVVTGKHDGALGLASGPFVLSCLAFWAYIWFFSYDWQPKTEGGRWMADSFRKMMALVAENAGYIGFEIGFFSLAFYAAPWWTVGSVVLLLGALCVTLSRELTRRMRAHERGISDNLDAPR